MADHAHESLDVTQLRRAMEKIHEQVASAHGRIELTRPECEDVCVILSKAELTSLERALEILAESDHYKAMCAQLTQLALDCDGHAVTNCAESV